MSCAPTGSAPPDETDPSSGGLWPSAAAGALAFAIALALLNPTLVGLWQDDALYLSAAESLAPEQLTDAVCRQIYAKCCELSAAGITPDLDRLLLEFDDPGIKSLLVKLDEAGRDRGGSDLAQRLPTDPQSLG